MTIKTFPIPSQPAPSGGEQPTPSNYAKGGMVKTACYAEGGPVYGRSRSFVKEPTEFTRVKKVDMPDPVPQAYAKSGKGKTPPTKKVNTPVPRS